MRQVRSNQDVEIPKGVVLLVDRRIVTVKGPKGSITRSFRHLQVDIYKTSKKLVRVEKWFGSRKELAGVRTVCSHISNMIVGVTKGYRYKMKSVYAHFPININVRESDTIIDIRNFLGEKVVRKVITQNGVTFKPSGFKDEFIVDGIDLEAVSKTCAQVHQSVKVKNKDIRKFLDGIYVSEKGNIDAEE